MSALALLSNTRRISLLRAALGCWHDAHGFAEHRSLAGYITRRALSHAGLVAGRRRHCTVQVGGLKLHLRPGGGELYLYQEIFRDRVYERHPAFALRPGWCVIDCGANIGMFSLRAARAGCTRIFALEPNPETFARLALNLERNPAAAVTALQAAAGNATGRAAFQSSSASTLSHLVSPHEESDAGASSETVVDVTTLATLFHQYDIATANLLKLDVEGAEAGVLEGARSVLQRVERIVMEYHGAERLAACEKLLSEHGFVRAALSGPAYAYFAHGQVC